jgi:hypothetical protein
VLGAALRHGWILANRTYVLFYFRGVRLLLLAEAISAAGSNLSFIALPWFVLVTTGSPARMGAVLAAEMVPVALLGIPGGRVATWLGGRRTMVLGDSVRAVAVGLIPLLHWAGALSFGALLALVAVLGACFAPYVGSQRTLLTELAGEDETATGRAMTLLQGVSRGASLVGPALGGLLLVPLGAPVLLAVDALSFAIAALLLSLLPAPRVVDRSLPAVGAGVRLIAQDPLLRRITGTSSAVEGAYQALFSALPVFVFLEHRDEPALTGLLVSAWAGGALLGVLPTLALLRRLGALTLARWAGLAQAAACWGLAAGLPPVAMAAALFGVGIASAMSTAPRQSLFTLRAPAELRASATSAMFTFALLAGAVGIATGGPAVEAAGADATFAALAALLTLAGVWFAWRTRPDG